MIPGDQAARPLLVGPRVMPPTPSSRVTGLSLLRERFSTISLLWADGGYDSRLVIWAKTALRLTVTVVKRLDDVTGFVVHTPRRDQGRNGQGTSRSG